MQFIMINVSDNLLDSYVIGNHAKTLRLMIHIEDMLVLHRGVSRT